MPTALPVSTAVDVFMQSANQAAMQTSLALVPGTNVQAYSATLAAVAGGTYAGAASITTLGTIATGVWNGTAIAVANGGTGATDAATARTNLGLGTIATQAASAVTITGGTITGLTNLGVAMANNTAATGISLGTITDTTSRPWSVSQTWNNSGLTATLLKVAATVTSAVATSKLIDLCAGSSGTSSQFSVDTAGNVMVGANATGDVTFTFARTTSGTTYIPTLKTNYSSNTYQIGANGNDMINFNISNANLVFNNAGGGATFSGGITLADAKNIAVNTTTGTKIGTATGQKLGFWNATPVVQQVLATGAGATVDNVISLLQTLGLCKQS